MAKHLNFVESVAFYIGYELPREQVQLVFSFVSWLPGIQ